MNRLELQELSRIRLREANALFQTGHYAGAYYLAGYAVECALKACIAKLTRRHDFPDKTVANKVWSHDLKILLEQSGLKNAFDDEIMSNQNFRLNWLTVFKWSENSRYEPTISQIAAKDYLDACSAPKDGVISWLKKKW